jgi:hypothetical protein
LQHKIQKISAAGVLPELNKLRLRLRLRQIGQNSGSGSGTPAPVHSTSRNIWNVKITYDLCEQTYIKYN